MRVKSPDAPAEAAYERLKRLLRHAIAIGSYAPGDCLPTTKQLCQQHQISTTTVRRAIGDLIQEGCLVGHRGKGVLVQMPHATASTRLLGVVMDNVVANPFFAELFKGISLAAGAQGYQLLLPLQAHGNDLARVEALFSAQVAGMVILPKETHWNAAALARLNQLSKLVPLVCLDNNLPGANIDVVSARNEHAARQAVNYLLDLGHRRIAFLYKHMTSTIRSRLRGYRTALEIAGIQFDPALIGAAPAPELSRQAAGCQMTLDLFRLAMPPTAVFATSDDLAIGVYDACHQQGIAIPEQLSVLGFDALPVSAALQPALTSVQQPTVEMGRKAAELLLARMADPDKLIEEVYLSTTLRRRASCSAPPPPKRSTETSC